MAQKAMKEAYRELPLEWNLTSMWSVWLLYLGTQAQFDLQRLNV